MTVSFEKVLDLAYGENPHQRAALYAEDGARRHVLSRVEQLQGKPLSFNNLHDLSAARAVVEEFAVPACAIVKHANPCGVALGTTVDEAFARAHAADPVSAYGGVVVCNRPVGGSARRAVVSAVRRARVRAGLRRRRARACSRASRGCACCSTPSVATPPRENATTGACSVESSSRTATRTSRTAKAWRSSAASRSEDDWGELLFAWRVCKHGLSNAIVVARELQTLGIGIGQMSRVDAVRIALAKARDLGHELAGSALASDAFFPFADGPRFALEAGVRAIIQPGGSKRDAEVIAAVEEAGATMVFTGRRHFRH